MRIVAAQLCAWLVVAPALARSSPQVAFEIAAQPLDDAIQALAIQSGRQMLFAPSALTARKVPRLSGQMTVARALQRLLQGTGLVFRESADGVILILVDARKGRPAPSPAPPAPPPPEPRRPDLVVTGVTLDDPVRFVGDNRRSPQARDVADVAQTTLGMGAQPVGAGQQGIILRGVGVAGDATTVIYFADVPISGPVGTTSDSGRTTSDLALIDIEQVEISRSPQGTQHGVGALAGEVEIRPAQARIGMREGFTSLSVSAMHGGAMGYQLAGAINLPVAEDLAVRLTGYGRRVGGYVDNIRTGDDNVNGEDMAGMRLSIRYRPNHAFDLSVLALWQHRRIDDQPDWTRSLGDYNTARYFIAPTTHDFGLGRVKMEWRPGPVRLTSISAWYRWTLDRRFDRSYATQLQASDPAGCARYFALGTEACDTPQRLDFSDHVMGFVPTMLHVPITISRATQEVRLDNGSAPGLRWRIGLFGDYRAEHLRSSLSSADRPEAPGNYLGLRAIESERAQAALFATLSHRSANGALAAFGLRYEQHDIAARNDVLVPNPASGSVQSWPLMRVLSGGLHAKLHIDIPATPWFQIHGQVARSFRPGGVNTASVIPSDWLTFGPDRLWGYEIGGKLDFGPAFQLTATGYLNDWTDMQYRALSENRSHAYLVNIGDTAIGGLEFELATQPVRGLIARLEGSLIRSRLNGASSPARALVGRLDRGDAIPFVPRYRLRATVGSRFDLAPGRTLALEGEWQHQSGFWSTFNRADPDFLSTPSFHLFGLGATMGLGRSTLTLSIRNLFDAQAVLRAQTNGYGVGQSYSYGPRTISLGLSRRW